MTVSPQVVRRSFSDHASTPYVLQILRFHNKCFLTFIPAIKLIPFGKSLLEISPEKHCDIFRPTNDTAHVYVPEIIKSLHREHLIS